MLCPLAKIRLESGEESKSDKKKEPTWIHVWPQVLATCISLSLTIQSGINMAFSAVLIPKLVEDPNITNFTKDEASWIASVVTVGSPVGALVVGPLMDAFGRKQMCVLSNVPLLLSWILTYMTSNSLTPLYIARALAGFGGGMTTVAMVYTAEISHVNFRPMLLSLNSVFVALGIMMATFLGAYIEWHLNALLYSIMTITIFILCLFLPESPYWLINFRASNQRTSKALKELKKLNRPDWLYNEESRRLKEVHLQKIQPSVNETTGNKTLKLMNALLAYADKTVLLPFVLLVVLFLLQQLSGVYVVIFYSVNIFQGLSGDLAQHFDEFTGAIWLGVLRFIMSILVSGLSRYFGRRQLMIVSSAGMAISAAAAGVFLICSGTVSNQFLHTKADVFNQTGSSIVTSTHNPLLADMAQNITSTPIISDLQSLWSVSALVSLIIFVCFGALGHMIIPWTLMSELMPIRARAISSGLLTSYASVLMFFTVKTFPYLLELFPVYYLFFFYAIISFISIVFVFFLIPETLGKSLSEIEKYFSK